MISFNQNNFKPELKDTNFNKIGVITLSTDFTIEQDYRKVCYNLPIDIFFNRIPFFKPSLLMKITSRWQITLLKQQIRYYQMKKLM